MLQSMRPQNTPLEPSSTATGFAGILAAFTASGAQRPHDGIDNLEDDIATLSYERTLQAHARSRPTDLGPSDFSHYPGTQSSAPPPDQTSTPELPDPAPGTNKPEHARKCASVTVRMSLAEHAQLQQRAAEADLTVSAYLRSCTFEAEALRTQVKQALAALRIQQPSARSPLPFGHRWLRFLHRPKTGAAS